LAEPAEVRNFRIILSESRWEDDMRAFCGASPAFGPLSREQAHPKEIQTEFFDGKTFTAATTSGVKFKMTFTARRQGDARAAGQVRAKGEGTWKLSKEGFCTSGRAARRTATRCQHRQNKWSVVKGASTVATWSK
jgi:hypothetical protein